MGKFDGVSIVFVGWDDGSMRFMRFAGRVALIYDMIAFFHLGSTIAIL